MCAEGRSQQGTCACVHTPAVSAHPYADTVHTPAHACSDNHIYTDTHRHSDTQTDKHTNLLLSGFFLTKKAGIQITSFFTTHHQITDMVRSGRGHELGYAGPALCRVKHCSTKHHRLQERVVPSQMCCDP